MVRTAHRPRRPEPLAEMLSEQSSSEESFNPRANSSHKPRSQSTTAHSPNTLRKSNRSNSVPTRPTGSQNAGKSKQSPSKSRAKPRKNPQPKKTTRAIPNIKFLQSTTHNLIPKAPFSRCVREILQNNGDFRLSFACLFAIQVAAETYLVELFSDSYTLTLHRDRVTLAPKDFTALLYLRGPTDLGNPQ